MVIKNISWIKYIPELGTKYFILFYSQLKIYTMADIKGHSEILTYINLLLLILNWLQNETET